MTSPVFFIDRDGVINRMVKYGDNWDSPQKSEDVKLVSGIVDVIKWANLKRIVVIEITNQPGVAKGRQTPKIAEAIESQVHELLKQSGVYIDHIYTCKHHPRGVIPELTMECECRKPKPGLLLQAAADLNIDLAKSVFLGDKASDAEAGKAAGCKTIIYFHDEDLPEKVEEAKNAPADYKIFDLEETVKILEIILT